MPTRVSSSEVNQLLDGLADNTPLSLYIEQANLLVNEELVGTGLSDQRLRIIELNLAAHFAVMALERGGFTLQRVQTAQEGYANDATKVKISASRFGQQALAMDSTGKLAAMDAPRGAAEFRVM